MLLLFPSDINDNVPFFLSSTYEATVPEGAQSGTSVAQVSAADLDSGLHGMVRIICLGNRVAFENQTMQFDLKLFDLLSEKPPNTKSLFRLLVLHEEQWMTSEAD